MENNKVKNEIEYCYALKSIIDYMSLYHYYISSLEQINYYLLYANHGNSQREDLSFYKAGFELARMNLISSFEEQHNDDNCNENIVHKQLLCLRKDYPDYYD